MRIVGHRGAAGLALENTLPSIELARLLGVDAIEFDVRMTMDNQLVLLHDADLSRVSRSNAKVSQLTLKELKKITLNDEHSSVPTLRQALRMAGDTPVIIEIKQNGCARELLRVMREFPGHDITVTSYKHEELAMLRSLDKNVRLFANELTKPFDVIRLARKLQLNGIGLNFWLINPMTYSLLKRHKLDLFVYTLNNKALGHFVKFLYPDAATCTDHPEWYIKHPWLKVRSGQLRQEKSLQIPKKRVKRHNRNKKRKR